MFRKFLIGTVLLAALLQTVPAEGATGREGPRISGRAASSAEAWPPAPPSLARGATIAKPLKPSRGRTRLGGDGGRRRAIGVETSWSGQPVSLLVLRGATFKGKKWIRLRLPNRPNRSSAWFRRDRFLLGHSPYWVRVRTASRKLTVFREGKRVRRFRAVVGAPETPTPRGLGAVYERNRQPDPSAFIGPWALSLTFLSDVLENYGGGPGRVAIHGRSGASLLDPLGTARSHGCIRISNRPVIWMARHLPRGTPVRITR